MLRSSPMTTVHEGKKIVWQFVEVDDELRPGQWVSWLVSGEDEEGKAYEGFAEGCPHNPEVLNSGKVEYIEEVS